MFFPVISAEKHSANAIKLVLNSISDSKLMFSYISYSALVLADYQLSKDSMHSHLWLLLTT